MDQIKSAWSKYKTYILITFGILIFLLICYLIIQSNQKYTVKEVIYDTKTKEIFIVRNDNQEYKQAIKPATDDTLFRDGKYLIIQSRLLTKRDDVVYLPDLDKGLIEVYKSSDTVLRYQDEKNIITTNGKTTKVLQNGEEKIIDKNCIDAIFFKSQFICIDNESNLFIGTPEKLEKFSGDVLKNYSAYFLQKSYDGATLYIAVATHDEYPKNKILEFEDEKLQKTLAEFEIDGVPTSITVQEDRTVLNVLRPVFTEDTKLENTNQYTFFTIDRGLQPLYDYRYVLNIIY